MRSRILKYAAILGLMPIVTTLLALRFEGRVDLQLGVLLLGAVTQIGFIIVAMRDLRRLFHPNPDSLSRMGVDAIPAPYEPGKFHVDFQVAACCMFLGLPAPLFVLLASLFPQTVSPLGPGAITYTLPSLELLGLAFLGILFSAIALIFWTKLGQAMVIANEPSEKKRYLLRGFAEVVDNREKFCRYLLLCQQSI